VNGDAVDPFERLRDAAERTPPAQAAGSDSVRRRVRRRRRSRRIAGAGVGATVSAIVVLAAGWGLGSLNGDDEPDVVTAAPIEHDPPPFVAEDPAWQEWDVTTATNGGVVDRDGDAAPVYRRDGDPQRVVVLLGESIPCLDAGTCTEPQAEDPDEIGFLDPAGPFAEWTAVYIPSWNNDFHIGRAPDGRVPGVRGVHQFVGADNVDTVRDALAAETPDGVERLVLAGTGGGAVGTLYHAPGFDQALAPGALHLLLDGAFVPEDGSILPQCMVGLWGRRWGAQMSIPLPDAPAAQPLAGMHAALAAALPDAEFSLIVHDADTTLRRFFGLADDDCALRPVAIDEARYTAALDATLGLIDGLPTWSAVVVPGTGHTVIDAAPDSAVTARVHEALRPLADPDA